MATIVINNASWIAHAGIFNAASGDNFIIDPGLIYNTTINGATDFNVNFEQSNPYAVVIATGADSRPTFNWAANVSTQLMTIAANYSASTAFNVGSGSTVYDLQGSLLGTNDFTFGNNTTVVANIYGGTETDTLTTGTNFRVTYGSVIFGRETDLSGQGDVINIGANSFVNANVQTGFGSDSITIGDGFTSNGHIISYGSLSTEPGSGDNIVIGNNVSILGNIWMLGVGAGTDLNAFAGADDGTVNSLTIGNNYTSGAGGIVGPLGSLALTVGDNWNMAGVIYTYYGDDTVVLGDSLDSPLIMLGQTGNDALTLDRVNSSNVVQYDGGLQDGGAMDVLTFNNLTPQQRAAFEVTLSSAGYIKGSDGLWHSPNSALWETFYIGNNLYSDWETVGVNIGPGYGNGIVDGTSGNDSMGVGYADAEGDTIDGTDGLNDSVAAGAGDDTVHAGLGDDTVDGGSGNDLIYGDDGNDSLLGNDGNDTIDAGIGNDAVLGGAGDDSITAGDGNDTVDAGTGNDIVLGGAGDDSLNGNDGNDTIDAGIGNDAVLGGAGDDSIAAGDGNDTVDAGTGNDSVLGGAGNDTLLGNDGSDTLAGGAGNDSLDGGANDDDLSVGAGDTAQGGAGDDEFFFDGSTSGAAPVTILGGETAEEAVIDPTNNPGGRIGDTLDLRGQTVVSLSYNSADPTWNGSTSESGTVVVLNAANEQVTINFSQIETVLRDAGAIDGTAGNDVMGPGYADGQGDQVDGADGVNDTIYGNGGNDSIASGSGNDLVYGGTGADTIAGGAGVDTVYGDAGDDSLLGGGLDTLYGGSGDDRFGLDGTDPATDLNLVVDGGTDATSGNPDDAANGNAGDILDLGNQAGNLSVTLGANPETGTVNGLDGDAGTDLSFTEIEQVITGAGNDTLNGGAATGPIATQTGAGDDSVTTGSGNDTVDAGTGNDTIATGAGDDSIAAGDGNDTVDAGTGNDVIAAGAGNDSVTAGDGNDTVDAGLGNDTVLGGAGDDSLNGNDGNDTIDAGIGNDAVLGGAGDDSITAGDGNDTVDAGTGNDSVRAGAGDDSVFGGTGNDSILGSEGNDTVDGGDGDDYINTRTSVGLGVPDVGLVHPTNPLLSYPADTDPNNDRDSVLGGAGNDTILTGDDADTVSGGAGRDQIDAGFDADVVSGGDDNDTIEGNEGADTLYGDAGNDLIFGGLNPTNPDYAVASGYELTDDIDPSLTNNADSLFGGLGDDTIYGQDDADTLKGGDGNDLLDGGIDNDSLFGEAGNDALLGGQGEDTLAGGAGSDTLTGGAGADAFVVDADGDKITDFDTTSGIGNSDATDNDLIDLSGYYNWASLAVWNAANPGQIYANPLAWMRGDQADGALNQVGGLRIESAGVAVAATNLTAENTMVVCFTRGTRIATLQGEVAIEDLCLGDMILTMDHGYRPIRWIGSTTVQAKGNLAPILFRQGALSNVRDLMVSPQHRMFLSGQRSMMMFGENEVLAAARHMVNDKTILRVEGGEVEYFHILFDQHEIIFAEGCPSESFHPGRQAWGALAEEARQEILELFPELINQDFKEFGSSARLTLKAHEVKLLVADRFFSEMT